MDIIHEETRNNPTIKLLMHYINVGWPCEQRKLPQERHPFWNFREDLSVEDGLATKSSRLPMHYINVGWPCEQRKLPQELHPFWNFREDLSVEDGLATKSSRLPIPSTLRQKVLEQIHEGHQGMEKCIFKARDSVFWPGISDDIWETVEWCGICQSTSRAIKPVGNVSEVPPHAWHTLGTDLFYWNKMDYLVVVHKAMDLLKLWWVSQRN